MGSDLVYKENKIQKFCIWDVYRKPLGYLLSGVFPKRRVGHNACSSSRLSNMFSWMDFYVGK